MSRYFYAYFDEKKKKPVVKNYGPTGNAGVLLINLKQRKEHNITQKALDYMKAHYETLSLGDEEALNNVFGEDFLLLDNKWDWATVFYNIHYSYQEGIAYLDDKEDHEDVVMHYIGKQKPWGRFSTNPKTLFYYKYLFKSPRWKPIDVIKYLYYSFVFFIIKNKYIYNFAHKIFTRVKKKILKS
jgi:lipopolysaccharide biosynthesis glycosyltransferase